MKFTDQINTILDIKNTPKKIICLVPSITELLVDLGLEESIIGITKFCIHPKSLIKNKTIVGGTKNIKIDVITALQPDIIICNKEENTQEIVENCREITTTYVSDIYTIADTLQLIYEFGKIFNCDEKATKTIHNILEKHNDFLKFMDDKKIKNVAYFIWKNPWIVVANNTFVNYLLEENKFENVFKDKERYPEIELQELADFKHLDYIFLSSEPYPFKEKDVLELKEKFNKTKIILVDGEYFSWYGSRLIKAFDYFKKFHENI